jgi:Flp pilus assembly protein TadB
VRGELIPRRHPPAGRSLEVARRRPTRFHATMSWKEEKQMLWTIGVVLIVLWVLGLVGSYTLGGFIHVLLVVALIVFLIQVIQGRRV